MVAVLSPAPAAAQAPSTEPILIVESVERPSASESRLLARLAEAARRHGLAAPPAPLESLFSSRGPLSDRERVALEEQFDRGITAWQDADFKTAILHIEAALAKAFNRPETLVRSIDLRRQALLASAVLALSYKRQGDPAGAREAMANLAVSFAGDRIPPNRFGPEPIALRKEVEAELDQRRAARLVVEVTGDRAATIYVNERVVGRGAVTLSAPLPGRYRVFAVGRRGSSRVQTVTLGRGDTSTLVIDLGFDNAVVLSPGLRLQFPDAASRARHERDYAARLGRLAGAERVAIIGVDGSTLSATVLGPGDAPRELEADAGALEELAKRIVGEGDSLRAGLEPAAVEQSGGGLGRRRSLMLASAGLGVASVGLGIGYFAIHEPAIKDGVRQKESRETFAHGVIATSVGGALIATAATLWWLERRESAASVAVTGRRGGGMLVVGGRF